MSNYLCLQNYSSILWGHSWQKHWWKRWLLWYLSKQVSKKANIDSESCVVTMCCISNKQLKPKLKHHSSPLVLTVRAKYFGFQIMKMGTCRFFVSLTTAGEWSFKNHGVSQFFVVFEFYLAYSLVFYKVVSESQCFARLKKGLRDQFICCFHNWKQIMITKSKWCLNVLESEYLSLAS